MIHFHRARRFFLPTSLESFSRSHPELRNWSPDSPSDYCPRCGSSLPSEAHPPANQPCPHCPDKPYPFTRIIRLAPYNDLFRDLIHTYKYARHWSLAPFFSDRLAPRIPTPFDPRRFIITDIPLHPFRRMQRGFNQSQLIARNLAKVCNLTYKPLLKRTRHTPSQTALSPNQRLDNMRSAFKLARHRYDLTGYHILIVDDIKTTGSTLAAASRPLLKAGATLVTAAVITVADPHKQNFQTYLPKQDQSPQQKTVTPKA
ncbi:ComF family protein [Poriferisphaera sp. WC338]|uniref:ComF family protein n=1 Tax=Poriferisphaera sp. WC338 TaxID=3425129 RepID=UPI003D814675